MGARRRTKAAACGAKARRHLCGAHQRVAHEGEGALGHGEVELARRVEQRGGGLVEEVPHARAQVAEHRDGRAQQVEVPRHAQQRRTAHAATAATATANAANAKKQSR